MTLLWYDSEKSLKLCLLKCGKIFLIIKPFLKCVRTWKKKLIDKAKWLRERCGDVHTKMCALGSVTNWRKFHWNEINSNCSEIITLWKYFYRLSKTRILSMFSTILSDKNKLEVFRSWDYPQKSLQIKNFKNLPNTIAINRSP